MRLLKQSTARTIMVFMTDSTDRVTGKTGLTLTITASKNGAAFSSISPTVTERGDGWYALALTTSHTDTLGDLAVHITATGADPTDLVAQVVEELPQASATIASAVRAELATELGRIDAAVSTRLANADYTAPANSDVAAIKAKTDGLTFTTAGSVDANIQYVNDVEVTGTGATGSEWGPA